MNSQNQANLEALFRIRAISSLIDDQLFLALDPKWRSVRTDQTLYERPISHPLCIRILELASTVPSLSKSFEALLAERCAAYASGAKPDSALKDLLNSEAQAHERQISQEPPSLEKAWDAIRALVTTHDPGCPDLSLGALLLQSDIVSTAQINEIVSNWKEDLTFSQSTGRSETTDIFWTSLDTYESMDSLFRYQLREAFGIGEFAAAFREVENAFGASLLSMALQPSSIRACGFEAFLVSRSRRLTSRINEHLQIAMTSAVARCSKGFYWEDVVWQQSEDDDNGREITTPDTYATALWAAALLRVATDSNQRSVAVEAARWLLDQQTKSGSWVDGIRGPEEDCLMTTVLALECLLRSRLPNMDRAIDRGMCWLLSQQNEIGLWENQIFPFPLLSILIMEFANLRNSFPRQLGFYAAGAQGLYRKAEILSTESSDESRRLAVIASFHATESLLYELLSQPTILVTIFEGKRNTETIGFRKALTEFEAWLSTQPLQVGSKLKHKNELTRLAYLRDEIVHKMIGVSESDCENLVRSSVSFARHYTKELLSYDLLA